MITNVDLEALEKLCAEATPGPWIPVFDRDGDIALWSGLGAGRKEPTVADAQFITAARTTLPQLIAEVLQLRAMVKECETKHIGTLESPGLIGRLMETIELLELKLEKG